MENIFEGAKFGDKFITRDGKVVLYLKETEEGMNLVCDENGNSYVVFDDGCYYNMKCFTNPIDYQLPTDVVARD